MHYIVVVDVYLAKVKSNRKRNFQQPLNQPWISLVQGDEQLDRPNSQTTMKLCDAWVAFIFQVNYKHNSFLLGSIQPSAPTTKELHESAFQSPSKYKMSVQLFRSFFLLNQTVSDPVSELFTNFGPTIVVWIRQLLPYSGPGFKSQAHHLH